MLAIIEGEEDDIAAAVRDIPDGLRIEPEILHWPDFGIPPVEYLLARHTASTSLGTSAHLNTITISATASGAPLPHAEIHLFLRGPGGQPRERTASADANGRCKFDVPASFEAVAVVVEPVGGFWTMVGHGPDLTAPIECPALPDDGPVGWWHRVLGIDRHEPKCGAGVTVGVVDTGAGPHGGLAHVAYAGAFTGGNHWAGTAGYDVDRHGSHVAGVIGALPSLTGQYAGLAPGCRLVVARVFEAGRGANQGDIANAIDVLSGVHQADIINLSLGADAPSETEHDAIRDAADHGTLCICAAGNNRDAVNYPAAFPEIIAVSAVGLSGWGPPGSLSAARRPDVAEHHGRDHLFLANFSSRGSEVDCCGPGVGVISTVPDRTSSRDAYAVMDGSSMASPATSGALAALLAANVKYLQMPRDKSRMEMARDVLKAHLSDTELHSSFQGGGLLFLPPGVV